MDALEKVIKGEKLYQKLFGKNPSIIDYKKALLDKILDIFKKNFYFTADIERVSLIHVPNRVELLGKHTDYQGGETFLLTGPKNFFALAAPSTDGITEMVNAEPSFGKTVLKLEGTTTLVLVQGVGSNYTVTVARRLNANLMDSGFSYLKNIKSVFIGDIPFGGGTSGSSAKVITDFLSFASVNELLENDEFISLILENGKKAGISMGQQGVDDFLLCLSMYLAHYENGLNFGDLKGDRGVGTFGGSEDHTAILLGTQNVLLFSKYCPTRILDKVEVWKDYTTVVAYSGRKAEKTREAMEKYNQLSINAQSAVRALNKINGTSHTLLRDFFPDLSFEERAEKAFTQLKKAKQGEEIAKRAFQFFMERDLTLKAVQKVKQGDISGYGQLINSSHNLSRDYLGNIVPEIDFLQKKALELGAEGATGFGAGFGGSCYAVVWASQSESFIERWHREYVSKFPHFKETAKFDIYPACRGCFWQIYSV